MCKQGEGPLISQLDWVGFSDVTRSDLEAAARSNKALSEHMVSKEADRAAKSFVVERLLALSEEQTEPKRFYSYDTLRGYGISGKADIAPALGELQKHDVRVIFPNSAKREHPTDTSVKRGIELVKAQSNTKG